MRALTTAYAAWIDRHRYRIVAASLAIVLAAGWVASRLSVKADLSYLLPPSAESVRDLRAIESRARVLGTVMVAVKSDDAAARGIAAARLRERFGKLPPDLVARVKFDDAVARKFTWEHRWQLISMADLEAGRQALRSEIDDAHLRANPLYVDLDDPPPPKQDAQQLRDRMTKAEQDKDAPAELVSHDGRVQLVVLRTAYSAGDIARDADLLAAADVAIAAVKREVPNVEIGFAGDVVLAVAEHAAILDGMTLALVATVGLVLLALSLYYRSAIAVGALSWSLVVGTVITFAFARIAIGHLNLATAFLSSIVIGNGINFGIVLLARYQEVRRDGTEGIAALAVAINGTLCGTLAAALTAVVAYGSLTLTAFRGFRDFGIIAGVGIVPCWIAAYTVLPALLAIAARRGLPRPRPEPALGRVLGWLAPSHPRARVLAMVAITAVAGVATWRYLADDPYESDFRKLRSSSPAIAEESHWKTTVDKGFGSGISGGFVIATNAREQVGPLVAKLRAHDAGRPEKQRLFSRVSSLDDLAPTDSRSRFTAIDALRAMFDDAALDELSPADRADALALRPPASLPALRDSDIPEELAWPYVEADGSRGRLVLAMSGWGYDTWNARDIVRFARDVRALNLGPEVLLGGSAFVFADMLELVDQDGPITTLASAFGALFVVLALVGRRRHGLVTLACGITGTLGMLALSSVFGLRVNFLDFVALPITIGIGIDYAANLAARHRHEGNLKCRDLLASTGSAVLLCSFTTTVGYGSLLLSLNQGIRSFGAAAILGEATCLGAALLFVPALLRARLRARAPAVVVA